MYNAVLFAEQYMMARTVGHAGRVTHQAGNNKLHEQSSVHHAASRRLFDIIIRVV